MDIAQTFTNNMDHELNSVMYNNGDGLAPDLGWTSTLTSFPANTGETVLVPALIPVSYIARPQYDQSKKITQFAHKLFSDHRDDVLQKDALPLLRNEACHNFVPVNHQDYAQRNQVTRSGTFPNGVRNLVVYDTGTADGITCLPAGVKHETQRQRVEGNKSRNCPVHGPRGGYSNVPREQISHHHSIQQQHVPFIKEDVDEVDYSLSGIVGARTDVITDQHNHSTNTVGNAPASTKHGNCSENGLEQQNLHWHQPVTMSPPVTSTYQDAEGRVEHPIQMVSNSLGDVSYLEPEDSGPLDYSKHTWSSKDGCRDDSKSKLLCDVLDSKRTIHVLNGVYDCPSTNNDSECKVRTSPEPLNGDISSRLMANGQLEAPKRSPANREVYNGHISDNQMIRSSPTMCSKPNVLTCTSDPNKNTVLAVVSQIQSKSTCTPSKSVSTKVSTMQPTHQHGNLCSLDKTTESFARSAGAKNSITDEIKQSCQTYASEAKAPVTRAPSRRRPTETKTNNATTTRRNQKRRSLRSRQCPIEVSHKKEYVLTTFEEMSPVFGLEDHDHLHEDNEQKPTKNNMNKNHKADEHKEEAESSKVNLPKKQVSDAADTSSKDKAKSEVTESPDDTSRAEQLTTSPCEKLTVDKGVSFAKQLAGEYLSKTISRLACETDVTGPPSLRSKRGENTSTSPSPSEYICSASSAEPQAANGPSQITPPPTITEPQLGKERRSRPGLCPPGNGRPSTADLVGRPLAQADDCAGRRRGRRLSQGDESLDFESLDPRTFRELPVRLYTPGAKRDLVMLPNGELQPFKRQFQDRYLGRLRRKSATYTPENPDASAPPMNKKSKLDSTHEGQNLTQVLHSEPSPTHRTSPVTMATSPQRDVAFDTFVRDVPVCLTSGGSTISLTCNSCDNSAAFICSGCRKIGYCTITCQKSDWRMHKIQCRPTSRKTTQ